MCYDSAMLSHHALSPERGGIIKSGVSTPGGGSRYDSATPPQHPLSPERGGITNLGM